MNYNVRQFFPYKCHVFHLSGVVYASGALGRRMISWPSWASYMIEFLASNKYTMRLYVKGY